MKRSLLLVLSLSVAALAGCQPKQAPFIDPFPQDVQSQLPENEFGLFKLDPKDYPDMRSAFMDRDGLERAIDKSLSYMGYDLAKGTVTPNSSQRFFPTGKIGDTITHQIVLNSLLDFKKLLHEPGLTADGFQQRVVERYEVWASKGFNWQSRPEGQPGEVWFTGYFTPIYHGSRSRTSEYQYPIYSRPDDLISDPVTGDVQGQRQADGSVRPYPTRRELMSTHKNLVAGREILWFKDPMEPYIIQVQGSAQVILNDGTTLYVGYAGKNGRDYNGLGSQLLKEEKLDSKHLSLPAVLEYFNAHPEEREPHILASDSFVFLKIYNAQEALEWPTGSLNRQVTPTRSLATDKKIFPRAAMTFITVDMPNTSGGVTPTRRFLLDQDTGGAIRAAGRADIYLGIGEQARQLAGRQFAQGHLYYLVLKPEVAGSNAFPALTPKSAASKAATPKAATPKSPTKPATGGDEMFPK